MICPYLPSILLVDYYQTAIRSQMATEAKRVTGYNLYMRDQMKVLKETVKDGSERLKMIGASWKILPEEEKGKYKEQAKAVSPPPKEKAKSGHKLSGYNLFMMERMPALKEQIPVGTDRLKAVAAEWKALPQEKKDEWKAKAK